MESKVDSWPPCSVCVEVKTPAGLSLSAPDSHNALVPSKKNFSGAAMLPKRVGLPRINPRTGEKIVVHGVRRPLFGHLRIGAIGGSRDRRHGAQPRLHAGDAVDAAAHLPSQCSRAALARIIHYENLMHQ